MGCSPAFQEGVVGLRSIVEVLRDAREAPKYPHLPQPRHGHQPIDCGEDARRARLGVGRQGQRPPMVSAMAGHEVLAIVQIRDRFAQGPEFLLQQGAGGNHLAVEGPAPCDLLPGALDLVGGAVPAVGEPA